MSTFTFKNREEYFKWMEAWKNEYWILSDEIRTAKSARKEYLWKQRLKDDKTSKKRIKVGVNPLYGTRTWRDPSVEALKEKATLMLAERREAKEESKRQRDEARNVAYA
jgi:hypothetical protein